MNIIEIGLTELNEIIEDYIYYFNNYEESEWTNDKVVKKFRQLVNREDYLGLGLYIEDELKGFAVGSLSQFDDGNIVLLNELFISKELQSKGMGSKLLKEFEKLAKDKGAFRIQLESANDEIHRRFYNDMHNFQDANSNLIKAKML